ncbi:substrate-binding domain-containing protein [Pantoea coffeiphila]|uniref:substrate-binding domain-containing protein n=1 Tax=Pantoea coffeiphila TaxID=1465635 RepID=UPI001EF8FCDA|nr:substrate-binding domain-containing protein [Pantoea coffeiphila]MBM7345186.1 DNA-binding LacI/PurR family transcriptional regulator [Pantoea coffeiphila]
MMKDRTDMAQSREDKTKIIGVVSDEFTNPYTVTLLNELSRQLNQRGCVTLLLNVNSRDGLQAALSSAAALKPDALIFLSSLFSDELRIAADILPQVPAIYIGSAAPDATADSIGVDGHTAGKQVARLLSSQGYSRFGYLQAQDSAPLPQQAGYSEGLTAAHHSVKQVLTAGGFDREHAWRATLAYLKQTWASERIDALFCDNDELAFGALQAVRDFGERVHVGVVGSGDTSEAHSATWHLTSLSQRSDLLVGEALSRLLDNHSDPEGAWRHGELKVRHSHLSRETFSEPSQCGCASRH